MSRQLTGYTILVTRPARQASGFARLIEEKGGTARVLPLIHTLREQEQWNKQLKKLEELSFDWIVFTSANAVRFFQEALKESETAFIHNVHIAAVGQKTAEALKKAGWQIDLMPDHFYAEELAERLRNKTNFGDHILWPKSSRARNVIPSVLKDTGALVTEMPLYTSAPVYENKQRLRQWIQEKHLDVLTFTSPSAVKTFCDFLSGLEDSLWKSIPVICIGPVTEKEASKQGFRNIRTAEPYTIEGMLHALLSIGG
ncbi:uroporphyrinogen-III synthase [Alteribacillus sp. YIM 98480]|uniref:uroporphyrinogen-III synthase n=1 Tax=Alteribacillus sp. YIM 98480 TaxID=2606599 RepID=UPI00131A683F|nr:uroporphyrinogen-III synthase [Alteribacillus sp. YIM 98480]